MVEYLLDCESLRWLQLQHLRNKILCTPTELNTIRKGVVAHSNLVVGSLHIVCFEWWSTDQQRIGNHSKAPDIDFIGVSALI